MPVTVIPLYQRLAARLIVTVGCVLLATLSVWAYLHLEDQKRRLTTQILTGTDRLTNTIRLGTHYAMMSNSRDDITQIIANMGRQEEIETIRIYNKQGQIMYANRGAEVNRRITSGNPECRICHQCDPPRENLTLEQRTRIFMSGRGDRMLGIVSPINNEAGCSTAPCHFHPRDTKILGVLDLVVSLADTDAQIGSVQRHIIAFTASVFLVTSAIILVFLYRFVNRPIRRMIDGTVRISHGNFRQPIDLRRKDEMGLLAGAIDDMGRAIARHQEAQNKQRDEYQTLFEAVPCLITVQDRQFNLLRYNREFARRFAPKPGDKCYQAYKNRSQRCEMCPVVKTFQDGRSHYAEESGVKKDGTRSYWIVRTSPVRDVSGEVVAAMEISHDITEWRQLEEALEHSEKKYHVIFSNIPNPVFVLEPNTYTILDCNHSVEAVYGYDMAMLTGTSFLLLFPETDRDAMAQAMTATGELLQRRQLHRDGRVIYVNIRISPSEYSGRKVLLVTTNDITQRLQAEQQLIQASKMATLGEMATGVAHELNQPLSVIKTAASFCLRKMTRWEPMDPEILSDMLTKVDANVDRASRIIMHMRQFARKSDLTFARIALNDVLHSAFEIFSQQLKARGIAVQWDLGQNLPEIKADAQRLEQVIINLLLNARDAIEEKRHQASLLIDPSDYITIASRQENDRVVCRVCDTGPGIPSGSEEKIFEPFYTTKEVGKGTGLGLSISYGIVQECRGIIRCLPGSGRGACFELSFPAAVSMDTDRGKRSETDDQPGGAGRNTAAKDTGG